MSPQDVYLNKQKQVIKLLCNIFCIPVIKEILIIKSLVLSCLKSPWVLRTIYNPKTKEPSVLRTGGFWKKLQRVGFFRAISK